MRDTTHTHTHKHTRAKKKEVFNYLGCILGHEIANCVNSDSIKLLSPEKICSCLLRRAAFLNELIRRSQ